MTRHDGEGITPLLVTYDEAASLLKVSKSTVNRLVDGKHLGPKVNVSPTQHSRGQRLYLYAIHDYLTGRTQLDTADSTDEARPD